MDLLRFFGLAQAMASLARFSQCRLTAPENVLQHTGFVTLGCYLVGLELNSVATTPNERINMHSLLARATVHDLEEPHIGDIARPTKYHSNETINMFSRLKLIAIKEVLNELLLPTPVSQLVLRDHAEAKHGRVGFVVDLMDKAAIVYKLWDECLQRGNCTLVKIALRLQQQGYLPALREHLASLHDFNAEQRFYLQTIISNLMKILDMVAVNNQTDTFHEADKVG